MAGGTELLGDAAHVHGVPDQRGIGEQAEAAGIVHDLLVVIARRYTYRTCVEAQRAAYATGIPHLSAAGEAAIGAMTAAKDDRVRGEAWRPVQADEQVAGELRVFAAAVERRFGDAGVRQMLRAGGRPGAVIAASVSPGQQSAVDRVASVTVTIKAAERAAAAVAQRHAESDRQGQRRGLWI